MQTDRQLVDAANRGDLRAFDALYERYCGWAIAVALRYTRDPETARDVTHDAFVWLLGRFPGFELRARMKTVLYPVIRNLALTQSRRRPMQPFTDEPAGPAPRSDDSRVVAAALGQLPAGQREVVLLRFADELSLAEIAETLHIPVGTVKSRLHLALQTLRADPTLKEILEIE